MTLRLSEKDRATLEGHHGEAARMAMSILTRMARVVDAPRLIDITAAHIDSAVYVGPTTLEYAERLAGLDARVVVPTTLNVSGIDEHGWKEWAVPVAWAEGARRQMEAYQAMGCRPTWTCAPYQSNPRPALGQQIAWGESSAIVFANSVLGARTERYPDLLDICAAITGRVPEVGLHLSANRAGSFVVELDSVPEPLQRDDAFYPVLGHLVGRLVGSRIPVIDGAGVVPNEDQLKALGAALASSGAVAMFHWVGVTPEAPDRRSALQGEEPEERLRLTTRRLRRARNDLSTSDAPHLDMVVLGSPHYSFAEFGRLVPLLEGCRCHPDVAFLITTSRAVRMLAKEAGLLRKVEAFGARVMVDSCILTSPMLPTEMKVLMTNSAKFAYYAPGLIGKSMVFGALQDCVSSAVRGSITRDDSLWQDG